MARTWPTISQSNSIRIRGKMLLDGRLGCRALFHFPIASDRHLQRLDVGSDMKRLDIGEFANAVLLDRQ
jgi:hypothetical protein